MIVHRIHKIIISLFKKIKFVFQKYINFIILSINIMNHHCINCKGTPLFLLSFSDESFKSFLQKLHFRYLQMNQICGIDVIECHLLL